MCQAVFNAIALTSGTGTIDNEIGNVTSSTAKAITPNETTTYTLTVTSENSVTDTETVTIEVVPLLIEIERPYYTETQVVHNRVAIWVGIVSEFEIAEVSVFIDDLSTSLVYEASSNLYGGALFLTGSPAGKYTLEIIATDIYGGSNNQTAVITLDNPPALTTSGPINHTVATPEVFIDLNCNDDVGDNEIIIKVSEDGYDGEILTSGINQIKGSYNLSAYDGQTVKLLTECRDTSNQLVSVTSTIHVESSSKLVSVKNSTGQVYDYDENRLLVHNTTSTGDSLNIAEMNSETKTTIEVASGTTIDKLGTKLTNTGAVYRVSNDDRYIWQPAFDWNNDELIDLGYVYKNSTTSTGPLCQDCCRLN